MGEAKRRRELQKHLEGINAEGQGVWRFKIYDPMNTALIVVKALAGDPYSQAVLLALEKMFNAVATANPPMLCLTCDTELTEQHPPLAWVLMHAHSEHPVNAMGNGICHDCCARHPGGVDDLRPSVVDAIRKQMVPDMRVISVSNQTGHG